MQQASGRPLHSRMTSRDIRELQLLSYGVGRGTVRESIANAIRLRSYRKGGASVSHQVISCSESSVARHARIRRGVSLWKSTVGTFSTVGRDSKLFSADVGRFTSISWNVTIGAVPHALDALTTHDFPLWSGFGIAEDDVSLGATPRRVWVGSDVWIGCHAVVMPGVCLGHGSVVGAGAVVTRDVAPFEIVSGVPAKRMRDRIPPHLAERILNLRWWDARPETLSAVVWVFRDTLTAESLTALETAIESDAGDASSSQ